MAFALFPLFLAWHLPLGSLQSSTRALVLHPSLISVTSGVASVISRLPETGLPHWKSCHICTGHLAPSRGQAGGTWYGRGVFHRVFHMLAPAVSPSAPNHVLLPRATHPASCYPTTGHCYGGGMLCPPPSPLCQS